MRFSFFAALFIALSFPGLVTAQSAVASNDVLRTKEGRFADITAPLRPLAVGSALGASEVQVGGEPARPAVPVATGAMQFELRASDRSVKNAFMRWGEEAKQQVVWRLTGDIPMDATGIVSATSLADAMTQIAAAFADKPEPFVIRHYDNALVVMSRWTARP